MVSVTIRNGKMRDFVSNKKKIRSVPSVQNNTSY